MLKFKGAKRYTQLTELFIFQFGERLDFEK